MKIPGSVSSACFTIRVICSLSRLPFLTVGILPFLLGTMIAVQDGFLISVPVFFLGIAGTICIMLAAYYAGEYYDQIEDGLGNPAEKSRFAGGSLVIQKGLVNPEKVRRATIPVLLVALVIGLVLWLICQTGPLTLPLGLLGMAGGYLYSAQPVRWVTRGLGELWIAFCYGWLAPAAAYYLQTGDFSVWQTMISIPVAASISAVIIINEFPDYYADKKAGKRNLLVRFGLKKGAILYGLCIIITVLFSGILLGYISAPLLLAPVLIGGSILLFGIQKGLYLYPDFREKMCCGTILLFCLVNIIFITAGMR
ncbi:MAG: prenyltransferase [Methanospirillaceae archaeon]|nr:prenyltransferase [Methanospirillaceae archaeon]